MTFRAAAPACPACGALLEGATLFDVRVERCPRCAGAWLDGVRAASTDEGDARAEGPGPRCPRCDGSLRTGKVGPADALECPRCGGAFVARASFADVLGAATSAGTMPPPTANHARVLAVLRALSRTDRL